MITKEKVEEGKAVFFSQEWAGVPYAQNTAERLFSWLSEDTIQIVKEVLGDRCFTVPVSDWTEEDQRAMNVICWLTAFE